MQQVAQHRPLRLLGSRIASENPVIVERLDCAVFALQFDPGAEEAGELQVAPRHRVSEREANRQRLRYGNRKGRIKQREVGASFRAKGERVNPRTAPGKEVAGAIHRYRHDFRAREFSLDDLLEIRQVGNRHL